MLSVVEYAQRNPALPRIWSKSIIALICNDACYQLLNMHNEIHLFLLLGQSQLLRLLCLLWFHRKLCCLHEDNWFLLSDPLVLYCFLICEFLLW